VGKAGEYGQRIARARCRWSESPGSLRFDVRDSAGCKTRQPMSVADIKAVRVIAGTALCTLFVLGRTGVYLVLAKCQSSLWWQSMVCEQLGLLLRGSLAGAIDDD